MQKQALKWSCTGWLISGHAAHTWTLPTHLKTAKHSNASNNKTQPDLHLMATALLRSKATSLRHWFPIKTVVEASCSTLHEKDKEFSTAQGNQGTASRQSRFAGCPDHAVGAQLHS
eukprot:866175-Pelagomonas_calceolata.AAC.4